jgi:hypothetical protein
MKRRHTWCVSLLLLGVALASKAEVAVWRQAAPGNEANTAKSEMDRLRPEIDEQLIRRFLTWIVDETHLLMPTPPRVLTVLPAGMYERAGGSRSVVALYEWQTATIYLPAKWDVARMYDRAVLLHELVHHVQYFNNVPAACAAQHERQAYALTAKWLAEQGNADPYAVLNTDELTVAILSMCPWLDK